MYLGKDTQTIIQRGDRKVTKSDLEAKGISTRVLMPGRAASRVLVVAVAAAAAAAVAVILVAALAVAAAAAVVVVVMVLVQVLVEVIV